MKFLIPEQFKKRLMRMQPWRIFAPVASVMIAQNLLTWTNLQAILASSSTKTLHTSVLKFTTLNTNPPVINRSLLKSASRLARLDLCPTGIPSLKPLSDPDVLIQRTNWKANSGFPHFVKKRELFDELVNLFKTFDRYCSTDFETLSMHPAVMFSRVQVRSITKLSIRAVYGEPAVVVANESRFSIPITEHFKAMVNSTYVIGLTQSLIALRMLTLYKYNNICLDFGSFDLTLHPDVITEAFSIVKEFFRDEPSSCIDLISSIEHRFKFGYNYHPLIGYVKRNRGLPSGSAFTNLIGSICNLIIIRYALLKINKNWTVSSIIVHGDDSVISTRVRVSVIQIARVIATLGMTINAEKTKVFTKADRTIEFLGSTWINGLPQRDFGVMAAKASMVTGKPIILKEGVDEYVKSRVFTMFGFDSRVNKLWIDLGWGKLEGSRVFVLPEAYSWDQSLAMKLANIEGVWVTVSKEPWRDR